MTATSKWKWIGYFISFINGVAFQLTNISNKYIYIFSGYIIGGIIILIAEFIENKSKNNLTKIVILQLIIFIIILLILLITVVVHIFADQHNLWDKYMASIAFTCIGILLIALILDKVMKD